MNLSRKRGVWLVQSRRRYCEQAATYFEQMLEGIRNREASAELSAAERATERSGLFNHAAALFSLDRYPEAIDSYTTALSRYQNSPESLAAYVQIAQCHRRLGHPEEAQTALSLAKVALDRMPSDAAFVDTTGLARDTWSSYLTWLCAVVDV